jgi:hypothetical protein
MTQQSSARGAPPREGNGREQLLELYDALAQYQLRDAGAEVAAAIAHAVGTPLNVISGRAELIRHDPSNALAQVARIEEQVKKLATGLRQLVDYLAIPDPRAPQRSVSVSRRTPADGTPLEARGVAPAANSELRTAGPAQASNASRASSPSRVPGSARSEPAIVSLSDVVFVEARAVLSDLVALTSALASASGVEVAADGESLAGARVERWHALGTLSSLVSGAVRHVASKGKKGESGQSSAARVRVGGSTTPQGVMFELVVPGLPLAEGWQLEHFQARPSASECAEFYRTLSICAAVVRGHGGKLSLEAVPNADAVLVRFSCKNEAG